MSNYFDMDLDDSDAAEPGQAYSPGITMGCGLGSLSASRFASQFRAAAALALKPLSLSARDKTKS